MAEIIWANDDEITLPDVAQPVNVRYHALNQQTIYHLDSYIQYLLWRSSYQALKEHASLIVDLIETQRNEGDQDYRKNGEMLFAMWLSNAYLFVDKFGRDRVPHDIMYSMAKTEICLGMPVTFPGHDGDAEGDEDQ